MSPPTGKPENKLLALNLDAVHDDYRGVVIYTRVGEGSLRKDDTLRMRVIGKAVEVTEIGRLSPRMAAEKEVHAGEVTVRSPRDLPDLARIVAYKESIVETRVVVPTDYIGAAMKLATDRRGVCEGAEYHGAQRVMIRSRCRFRRSFSTLTNA